MCMTQYINVQGRRTLRPAAGRKTRRKILFFTSCCIRPRRARVTVTLLSVQTRIATHLM